MSGQIESAANVANRYATFRQRTSEVISEGTVCSHCVISSSIVIDQDVRATDASQHHFLATDNLTQHARHTLTHDERRTLT
jgi:hypothetical protein